MPAVSVIIPTLNGRELLVECLAALEGQRFWNFETIVVDNASTDGTRDWLSVHYPDVRLVALASNHGFAGACNAGIAAAKASLIALLNNDAVADKQWLEALVKAAHHHPRVASFASQIRMMSRPDTVESLGDFYSVFGWAGHIGLGKRVTAVPAGTSRAFSACACAALYRRSALEKIGGFDEDFFVSHEDVDVGFRLQLRGEECLCVHEAVVLHRGFGTRKVGDPRTLFLSRRNQWYVLAKDMPGVLLFLLSPFLLLGQVLGLYSRFTQLGILRSFIVTVQARRAALRTLRPMIQKRRTIQAQAQKGVALVRDLAWHI